MESLEKTEEQVSKKTLHWKKFWKEQAFLCILAVLFLIVFLIIYFVLSDIVYLYLSLLFPLCIMLWIGGAAIVWYIKNKKNQEVEIEC